MKLIHRLSAAIALALIPASMALAADPPATAPATRPASPESRAYQVLLNAYGAQPGAVQVAQPYSLNISPKMVKAAYLGVSIAPADATLQAQLKLPAGVGLTVTYVEPDGPAKSAGLQEHDVLYKIDDQYVINIEQFQVLVRMHKPGDKLEITAIREAQTVKMTATLVEKEVPDLAWTLSDNATFDQSQLYSAILRGGTTTRGIVTAPAVQYGSGGNPILILPAATSTPATKPAGNMP